MLASLNGNKDAVNVLKRSYNNPFQLLEISELTGDEEMTCKLVDWMWKITEFDCDSCQLNHFVTEELDNKKLCEYHGEPLEKK